MLPASGKYVPSIGHLILQQQAAAQEAGGAGAAEDLHRRSVPLTPALKHTRPLPKSVLLEKPEVLEAPNFQLKGLIIVSGLTDPATQVGVYDDEVVHPRLHAVFLITL